MGIEGSVLVLVAVLPAAPGRKLRTCTTATVRGSPWWSSVACSPCGMSLLNAAEGASAEVEPRGARSPVPNVGDRPEGRPIAIARAVRPPRVQRRAGSGTPSSSTTSGTGRGPNGPSTWLMAACPALTRRQAGTSSATDEGPGFDAASQAENLGPIPSLTLLLPSPTGSHRPTRPAEAAQPASRRSRNGPGPAASMTVHAMARAPSRTAASAEAVMQAAANSG